MSFYEGLQAELSKGGKREPFFVRCFLRLMSWYDRLGAWLRRRGAAPHR